MSDSTTRAHGFSLAPRLEPRLQRRRGCLRARDVLHLPSAAEMAPMVFAGATLSTRSIASTASPLPLAHLTDQEIAARIADPDRSGGPFAVIKWVLNRLAMANLSCKKKLHSVDDIFEGPRQPGLLNEDNVNIVLRH